MKCDETFAEGEVEDFRRLDRDQCDLVLTEVVLDRVVGGADRILLEEEILRCRLDLELRDLAGEHTGQREHDESDPQRVACDEVGVQAECVFEAFAGGLRWGLR